MLRNTQGPIGVFIEYSTGLLVNYFYCLQIDEVVVICLLWDYDTSHNL